MVSFGESRQEGSEEVLDLNETSFWSSDSSDQEEAEETQSHIHSHRNSLEAVALAQIPHGRMINDNKDNEIKLSLEPGEKTDTIRLESRARHSLSDQSDVDIISKPSMSPLEPFPSFRYSLNTPSSTSSTPLIASSSGERLATSFESNSLSHPKPIPQSYIPTNKNSTIILPLEFELLIHPTIVDGPAQFYDRPCIVPFLAGSIELCASTQYQDLLQGVRDKYNELVAVGKMPGLPIVVNQVTLLSLKSDVEEDNMHYVFGMMRRREGGEILVATIKLTDSWKEDVDSGRVWI